MKTGRARMIIGCLRRAAAPDAGLTDGQLLRRYAARRDDDAFAALVRRHGPLVYGVCRRVLGHAQDAEDAFQAAFVILARRAGALAGRDAIAGWLHKVAYHAALAARASVRRRRAKERQVEAMPHPTILPEEGHGDLLEALDRELARLPERHRLPLVLCELEGRSRKEAARQLGLAEGTLSSRLARGRKMLARRIAAHGATATAAALAGLLSGGARAACVPGALVVSTVRAAGGAAPAGVAALAKGVMKAMLLTKLKCAAWALVVAAAVGVGATAWAYGAAAAEPPARPPARFTAALPADPAARPDGSNKDDLEALRLEVEALRLELKATKERVKALEDQAQKPQTGPGRPPTRGPGGAAPGPGFAPTPPGAPPDNGAGPGGVPPGFELGSAPGFPGGRPPGAGAPAKETTAAPPDVDLDAALKALKQNPDDKQALDALLRALRRQKDQQPQTPPGRRP